jgi:hypothetical protein
MDSLAETHIGKYWKPSPASNHTKYGQTMLSVSVLPMVCIVCSSPWTAPLSEVSHTLMVLSLPAVARMFLLPSIHTQLQLQLDLTLGIFKIILITEQETEHKLEKCPMANFEISR